MLFPYLDAVRVDAVFTAGDAVHVVARTRDVVVRCPDCAMPSERVHSTYERHLADGPVGDQAVRIDLSVRRLYCENASCPRCTFAEQVDGLTVRYGRRTPAFRRVLEAVAVALAGRSGARFVKVLHSVVSRMMLLRLVMAMPDPTWTVPKVLGVDDFARRRVIWSRPEGVLHVVQGAVRLGDLRGGGGYLPPSMTQIHGGVMLVQRVVSPLTQQESWTVLGDDDVPVGPIERYLSYLTDIERSPNTIKAYAHDLKDYFGFLMQHGLDWREVRLEDLGEFVAWLRRPPRMRDGDVAVLPSVEAHCTESTVNRKLSALSAFYEHAARHGVDLGELLITWQPAGRRRGSWKPFLHHVGAGRPVARRTISLKAPRKLPRVLTAAETQSVLDACGRLRDRFLFALLHESGVRIGEALGLRHEDIAPAERELSVVPRLNDNGARTKSRQMRQIPVSAELVRLYADYLHGEYGDLDSDYVFVNLWGRPHGRPLTYAAVYDLVRRIRRTTRMDFDPHWFRHGAATRMLRDGVPIELVSKVLGHADISTTIDTYGHLTAEDARRVLEDAGWFAGREVTL
ncbi:tyrosine-type recombinase/integrase [Streptomyces spectabilis]|uniref:tyrosine-type recombinase/integrase n=1 Tax=Streptomyces spectabilis TaxID=68270 RepID=UPI0033D8E5F5